MSIIGFIVLGDRTSHGGVVVSGDPTWTIDGQHIARVGDKVTCPRCKRDTTIVTSRFPTVIDLGKPEAYDQDTTDCGAVIYSRHNGHAGWGEAEGGTESSNSSIENYVRNRHRVFRSISSYAITKRASRWLACCTPSKPAMERRSKGRRMHKVAPMWCGRTRPCRWRWLRIRNLLRMPIRTILMTTLTIADCNARYSNGSGIWPLYN